MPSMDFVAGIWFFLGLQAVGLLVACLARMVTQAKSQTVLQMLFFVLLFLVGVTTMAAFQVGPGYWLVSGTTLALMILVAVCDFSRMRSATAA